MTKKYIEDLDAVSKFSKKIIQSHPDGFLQAVIDGARGSGKTAFCMHTMREVYQYLYGVDRVEAWNIILGIGAYSNETPKILFTMRNVIDALKQLENIDMSANKIIQSQRDNMIPVLTWDDAGMHGGRLKVLIDMKAVDKLSGVMDTARDVVSGFLINVPEKESLLSAIRRYKDAPWVHIGYRAGEGAVKYDRQGVVRKFRIDGRGTHRSYIDMKVNFSCYVDKWVYSEYKIKKVQAVQENLRMFEELEKRNSMRFKKKDE